MQTDNPDGSRFQAWLDSTYRDATEQQFLRDTYARVCTLPQTPLQWLLTWLFPKTMARTRDQVR